jgi:hypothetical protein
VEFWQTLAMIREREQEAEGRESAPRPAEEAAAAAVEHPTEIGGPKGLEPTRYGDWERAGRCVDF